MQGYLSLFTKYAKVITMSVLIVFAGTLLVGIAVAPQLSTETSSCIFDSSEGCIGVSEHILEWQNTFNISPEQNIFPILTMLLTTLGAFIFVAIPIQKQYSLIEIIKRYIRVRRQVMLNTPIKLFDYIRTIFSDGVLHPKLFTS